MQFQSELYSWLSQFDNKCKIIDFNCCPECFNTDSLEIASQFLLCYNNMAIVAKATLKGTSFNIHKF